MRCDFAWPATSEWGSREHLCDLEPGHYGDHECGWCIVCDACEYTATASAEPRYIETGVVSPEGIHEVIANPAAQESGDPS